MKIRRDARSEEPCAEGSDKEGNKDRCGGLSAAFRAVWSEKWVPASSCYRDACVFGRFAFGTWGPAAVLLPRRNGKINSNLITFCACRLGTGAGKMLCGVRF
ncbi:pseudouridine synthase [Neisseria meningitidis]|uniref:Beta-lactamase induction signal transducer protein n=1 Tax=Neisseria meningitidis alpha153 TaxID=663926 RepID=C6SCH6_NEIME|nr:pseudouridine synthase [Neisseria meningitidis]CBA06020.1 beta-lactamase induction signal transducer protein [Neisseria meningitidis alpha153]ANX24182.1 pseudouridine synthase [Neisseria meningitidis]ANX39275.1 pseudouridine synthase [Neisseria meningitidis]ANX51523.1 pseudouridine synthase [Neisseria meningitidis]